MQRKKLFNAILITWLAILTPIFIIAFLELITRFHKASGYSLIVYNQITGWRYKANSSFKLANGDTVSFNQYGFRDKKWSEAKDKKRILLLGDSFSAGLRVGDHKIFPALLEKELDVEVINTGVSAWGTKQQLAYLKKEGLKFKPDMILLVMTPNDIRESYNNNQYHQIDPKEKRLWWLSNNSTLFQYIQYNYLKSKYGSLLHIFTLFPVSFNLSNGEYCRDEDIIERNDSEVEKAYENFEEKIAEMIQISKENNIPFYITVTPTSLNFYREKYYKKIDEYISKRFNSFYLDSFTSFDRYKNRGELYIKNDYHFTEKGHEVFARNLINQIKTLEF